MNLQLRQPDMVEEVVLTCPGCSEETYPAAIEAPRDEAEDARAGSVQPGQVVNDDQQRSRRGRLPKEHEGRIRHDKPAWGSTFAEAQRDIERISVEGRKLGQRIEEGEENLIQA